MAKKSDSCFDARTGEALDEYDRRSEAARATQLDPLEWRAFEPYHCEKCHKWHRRPVRDDGPVPTDVTCLMCRGRDGRPKISHPTPDAALAAIATMGPRGAGLGIYVCPHGRGWHLTSA